jgi:hypothetical protein
MLSGVHQLVMHAFDAVGFVILCSPFEYLVSFRVLGEAITRYTWNPNTVHYNKFELGLAMIRISLTLRLQG